MITPYTGTFRVSQEYKGLAHDGLDLVGVSSKNIYATVNGTVEIAGPNDPGGFGTYVRIKKEGTNDKYYYGHMSEVRTKVSANVRTGDLIGIEGSTGHSTGSHCHYCARKNGDIKTPLDISSISGIPNKIGTYTNNTQTTPVPPSTTPTTPAIIHPPGIMAAGSKVKIRQGAVYGGLSSARGTKVPQQYIGQSYTVTKLQTNNGVYEALIKELESWVATGSLDIIGIGTTPPSSAPSVITAGSKVKIKPGAAYGGLSSARGKLVPSQYTNQLYTVTKVQVNNGVNEALIKELDSWVAVASLIM